MKKFLGMAAFLTAVILLVPLFVLKPENVSAKTVETALKIKSEKTDKEKESTDTFRVYNKETGKIETVSAEDYILSVVAAEVPALYETEAIKAQAVAAYTYAVTKRNGNKDCEYDITTDYKTDQAFISKEALKDKWGENSEVYINKLTEAIKSVSGLVITYDSEPISAVYHAISSGKTESSENVWGKARPYLKAVSSEGDKLSPDYKTEAVFTADELKEKLKSSVSFSGEAENFFGKFKRTDSGYVKTAEICGTEISGADVCRLLNLRSTDFSVKYADNCFTFTVLGYGHGVGMSQNGANYMAKQGSDFKEILLHYYSGCKIEKL